MKNQIKKIAALPVLIVLAAGCSTGRKTVKTIETMPQYYVVTPDSNNAVKLDMEFNIPSHYFSKRSRLIILPQLVENDSVKGEFTPLVLDAPVYNKKKRRQTVLDDEYVDPYSGKSVSVNHVTKSFSWPYRDECVLAEKVGTGHIRGVVTTDGCGECSATDTLFMAGVSNPITLLPPMTQTLKTRLMEPKFVVRPKIVTGGGMASLQFVINRYDINLSLGNNSEELDGMVRRLVPVVKDSLATLTTLTIDGMASADGALAFNTALAKRRAASAKDWLVKKLEIDKEVQKLMKIGSRPEGWMPVLEAMTKDGNPDSVKVKEILLKYSDSNDDVQEKYIRRLSCWKQIKDRYLQKDRKVLYAYKYSLRSFTTDFELVEMYGKRPDAFNEEELNRVAQIAKTDAEKIAVYRTVLKYFPQSVVAANNLSVIYLRQDRVKEALDVLENREGSINDEILNTLAVANMLSDDLEEAGVLLGRISTSDARYNMGILCASQQRLDEAYSLLKPYADLNAAICALSVRNDAGAMRIMNSLDNVTPLAEYVRALVAARMGDEKEVYSHLVNASVDVKLKRRMVQEPDFLKYRGEKSFEKMMASLD